MNFLQSLPSPMWTESQPMNDSKARPVNPPDDADTSGRTNPTQQLTDAAREEAIARAGEAMVKAHEYGRHHQARELLRLQNLLIAGRSPEYVARLEAERGLA